MDSAPWTTCKLKGQLTAATLTSGASKDGEIQYAVQYSNCGRGSQTSALASEPQAHEGAQRAQ